MGPGPPASAYAGTTHRVCSGTMNDNECRRELGAHVVVLLSPMIEDMELCKFCDVDLCSFEGDVMDRRGRERR